MTKKFGVEDLDPCRSAVKISGQMLLDARQPKLYCRPTQKSPELTRGALFAIRRRPALSRYCQCGIIDAGGISFRVRNGNAGFRSRAFPHQPPAGLTAGGFWISDCYIHSSIRTPRPTRKSVTNQVVRIPPPVTIILTDPAFRKGLIIVSGGTFIHVAYGSRP